MWIPDPPPPPLSACVMSRIGQNYMHDDVLVCGIWTVFLLKESQSHTVCVHGSGHP
jgi:hypothetical protein